MSKYGIVRDPSIVDDGEPAAAHARTPLETFSQRAEAIKRCEELEKLGRDTCVVLLPSGEIVWELPNRPRPR